MRSASRTRSASVAPHRSMRWCAARGDWAREAALTSTTRATPATRTRSPRWRKVWCRSTRPSAARAGVPSRRTRPATSRRRTWSTCFGGRVLKPASTSTHSSRHRGGSAVSSAKTCPGCWRVRATTLFRMPKRAGTHKVAVIQHPPVTLNRQKTLERGVELIEKAASAGARLISFPETWVPGYPEWLWRLRPGGDHKLTGEIHRRLIENAVDLKAGDLKLIQAAARRLKVTVSIGVHERDGEFSRGTLSNTAVPIGSDRAVPYPHRKLVPTNPEPMVWGMGDASGLRVSDTPMGPVAGLNAWG